jgi:hypothetical protein
MYNVFLVLFMCRQEFRRSALKRRNNRLIVIAVVLIAFSLACNAITGAAPEAETASTPGPAEEAEAVAYSSTPPEPAPTIPEDAAPASYDNDFPLPTDVQNFMELGYEGVNFQTGMSLKDVIAFYRQAFSAQGLEERDLLTILNDEVFSMVFDGAPNGKAVVIQGVLLGSGSVNINIRYEDT